MKTTVRLIAGLLVLCFIAGAGLLRAAQPIDRYETIDSDSVVTRLAMDDPTLQNHMIETRGLFALGTRFVNGRCGTFVPRTPDYGLGQTASRMYEFLKKKPASFFWSGDELSSSVVCFPPDARLQGLAGLCPGGILGPQCEIELYGVVERPRKFEVHNYFGSVTTISRSWIAARQIRVLDPHSELATQNAKAALKSMVEMYNFPNKLEDVSKWFSQ